MRTLLRDAAASVVEIQLHHLDPGGALDDAQQIADDMLDFIESAVSLVKKPVHGTLKKFHDDGLPGMDLAAR